MSTTVNSAPCRAANARASAVSSAAAAPEPEYRAVNACGTSPASAMLATTADESRPPLRKAATGTSLSRCAATDSSSQSRTRASGASR